jgi:transposase
MPPSSTLDVGLDVHQESMAGAEMAQEHGAEVTSLGTLGTRPYALDQLTQNMPPKAQHRVFVYDAGSCGSWLYRDLTKPGYDCRRFPNGKLFIGRQTLTHVGCAMLEPRVD